MNKKTMLLYASLLMSVTMCSKSEKAQDGTTTPVKQPVMLADPFVLKHDGAYYLYGTSGSNPDGGIPVYKSSDGKNWEGPVGKAGNSLALAKGQAYGTTGFWAPEVFYRNNKFYMFYTANEHIAVATSDSPLGPFTQTDQQPLHAEKEIDPHVFTDDNSKSYLYFVRFDNGNKTFGAELNDDWKSIKDNTVTLCIKQTDEWEVVSGAQWPVTEAPAMLKHKNLYYLFYTANDFRSPAYNVGYATASSPLGPFTKYSGNPIIPKTDNIQGTGHNAFVTVGDSIVMYYHAHNNPQQVGPRRTLFSTCGFVAGANGVDVLKVNEGKQIPQIDVR
ncbi:MAG: beta-xylosidase [Citrobacter freundii]|nr:MAG: beta-xylosidase [Citrobacter freundii]